MHQKHPPAKRAVASLSSIAIDFACRGTGVDSAQPLRIYWESRFAPRADLSSDRIEKLNRRRFESPLIVFERTENVTLSGELGSAAHRAFSIWRLLFGGT